MAVPGLRGGPGKPRPRLAAPLLCAALAVPAALPAFALAGPPAACLERRLDAAMQRGAVPGVQVAVTTEEGEPWAAARGVADLEAGAPLERDSVMAAGSISKLLVATLIAQQVERGDLDLHQDVNRYLPEPRRIRNPDGAAVPVRLRRLLSHASGLPRVGARPGTSTLGLLGSLTGLWASGDPPAFGDYLAEGLVLRREPGRELRYSNDAFLLLGWLSAEIAGRPFPEHARHALLDPLKMRSSDFRPDAEHLRGRRARLYERSGSDFERVEGLSDVRPSASLQTTAEDLLQFAELVLSGGLHDGKVILRRETLGAMTRLQASPAAGVDSGYGLGFAITRYRERRMLCHTGRLPGASGRLCLIQSPATAVVALANADDLDFVQPLTNRLLDCALGLLPLPAPSARGLPPHLAGFYRPVGLLPDQLGWLEPLIHFPLERIFRLEPLDARRYRYRIRGGHADGEVMYFGRGDDGRFHGYLGAIHVAQVPLARNVWLWLAIATALLLALATGALIRRGLRRRRGL